MILIAGVIFVASNCFADVLLYRYIDKKTGNEAGVSYSDKNGNAIKNDDWQSIEISEKDKKYYIDLKNAQQAAMPVEKSEIENRLETVEKKIADMEKPVQ